MIPGTDQLVQDPADSSVAAAERAACGGPGGEAAVGLGPDVMELAELGTEQRAEEEAA